MKKPDAPGTRTISGTRARIARVLVIDDEPTVAAVLRVSLSDEFQVTVTSDPHEALGWLTSGDWYDVILCDVMMPALNGLDLRDCLHAQRPDLASRIVFVTGGLLYEHLRLRLDQVPNMVLAKPFNLTALREMIRRRTASNPPPGRASKA